MREEPKIPIRNIYWMLCYAWNTLSQSDEKLVDSNSFKNIYDLLSKVLANGVRQLLRRGFARLYCPQSESLTHIRGRIKLNASIKQQTFLKRKMICDYDVFTPDIPFNQILKFTINCLLSSKNISAENRRALIKVKPFFSAFSEMAPTRDVLSKLRYNRNNQHYRQLIDICTFIYNAEIADEQGHQFRLSDFLRDKQMATLYEKFVLNFYRKHLNDQYYHVHLPKISWDVSGRESDLIYLPDMRTDIVLDQKITGSRLIIDTKFYPEALRLRNYGDTKKLISGNLYQMYAYLGNDLHKEKVMGMLLYPTVANEIKLDYIISGHPLLIRTIDLNQEWACIEEKLMGFSDLIKSYLPEQPTS